MASIRFPEGTTYRMQWSITDSKGVIINLSGAQLTFAIYLQNRPKIGVQPTVVPVKDNAGNGDIFIKDAAKGIIVVTFHPHEFVDLANTYDWELQLIEADGDVWLAGKGALIIQPARRLDTVPPVPSL